MDKYKIIFESKLSWGDKIKTAERLAKHQIDKSIFKNIKESFKGETLWSRFTREYKNIDGDWVSSTCFYYHDLEGVDLKNDWRFREVKNKRSLAKFEGLEFHVNNFNLPLNHINDYLKYLNRYER